MISLNLNGEQIPLKVVRDKRVKRIKLYFKEGFLNIVASRKLSTAFLNQLMITNREWLLQNWQSEKAKLKTANERYQDGGEFWYRGKILKLKLILSEAHKLEVSNSHNELLVRIPKAMGEIADQTLIKQAVANWYQKESEALLKIKLDLFSSKIGVNYHAVRFKHQRTRWGSCSSKGNINLNWLIIMAPDEVMDYIIIHELSHLCHMNHSQPFWDLVKRFNPNYKYARLWLKMNGDKLKL